MERPRKEDIIANRGRMNMYRGEDCPWILAQLIQNALPHTKIRNEERLLRMLPREGVGTLAYLTELVSLAFIVQIRPEHEETREHDGRGSSAGSFGGRVQ